MQTGDDVVWYNGRTGHCRRKFFGVLVRIDGDTALVRRFGTSKRLAKRLADIQPASAALPTYKRAGQP